MKEEKQCFVCTPEDKSITCVCNEHSMSMTVDKIKCPKCGWECNKYSGLRFETFGEIDGDYCTKCWATYVSERIPKMVTMIGNSGYNDKEQGLQ